MAGEREGEDLGGGAGVCRVGERERGRSPSSAGRGERRGGGQLRGMHAVLAVEQLPACLAKPSSSLEWWLGWAGRWASRWCQVSFFPLFLFLFLFCKFVEFLKIPRTFQKSPNCTWSLVGIFPAWNILVWDYLSIKIFL